MNEQDRIAREIVVIDLQLPDAGESGDNDQIARLAVERQFLIEDLVETIRPAYAEDGHNIEGPLTPNDPFYFDIVFAAGGVVGFEHAKDAVEAKDGIEKQRRQVRFRLLKFPKPECPS